MTTVTSDDKLEVPRDGSLWAGTDMIKFRVLHTITLDNHIWVHYIKHNSSDAGTREYSCYVESFLERFNEVPDDATKRVC